MFEGQDVYCLLVDDDPLQLALTEELLKQSHVQVVGCTNPHNVLELLRNTVFNAIITDIQMPTLDGYHLLERIRTSGIPGTDEIPVIALSASIAKEHEHYLEAGFTVFLNKPFTAAQLVADTPSGGKERVEFLFVDRFCRRGSGGLSLYTENLLGGNPQEHRLTSRCVRGKRPGGSLPDIS